MNTTNSTANVTEQILGASNSSSAETSVPPIIQILNAFATAIQESGESSVLDWDRFGAILTYCCSIYGLSCLIMAFILNRTLILATVNTTRLQMEVVNSELLGAGNRAATLHRTRKAVEYIKKLVALSLRGFAIVTLLYNCFNVLVALDFAWKSSSWWSPSSALSNPSHPAWISSIVRFLLFGYEYDTDNYAHSKYMSTPQDQVQIGPTADMYWPIFLGFCVSSFVETFISVIKGRKPFNESGITIFEHSMAYHSFSSKIGFLFSGKKIHLRPTEEVLVCSLFSIFNHLNIHIGALLNDNKFRLVPSTILGTGFMVYMFQSVYYYGKLTEFPFIIFWAYVPQFFFVGVVIVCFFICGLAFVSNGCSLTNLNYANFFQLDEDQAGAQDDEWLPTLLMRNFNIKLTDDFYSSVLNLGTSMVSVAGKSCYIKELGIITVTDDTWLEKSLWERISQSVSNPSGRGKYSHGSVFQYLKDKNISGYSNLIKYPSERLLKGQTLSEFVETAHQSKYDKYSVAKRRVMYSVEAFRNLTQLFVGISKKLLRRITSVSRRASSTEQRASSRRRLSVPPFLQRFVQPPQDSSEQDNQQNSFEGGYVNVDDLNEDQLSSGLLSGTGFEFSEIDSSKDYEPVVEYPLTDQSDIESDAESIDGDHAFPFDELISSPQEFTELVNSSQELRHHMSYKEDRRMTRSMYVNMSSSETETKKLMELILDKRKKQYEALCRKEEGEGEDGNEIEDFGSKYDCVVCQVNPREIITWPCKCFAVCESCRLSLVTKGMEGCVCCRRDVEGVTRVFIP